MDSALGHLLMATGEGKGAEPLFREAVELRQRLAEQFPADASHQNSFAWLLANCAAATPRDPTRAVELANKAVKLDPQRSPCWNTLGTVRFRAAGQWKLAIEALQKSVELSARRR